MGFINFLRTARSVAAIVGSGLLVLVVPSTLNAEVIQTGTFKDVRITFDLTNVPVGTQIGQNVPAGVEPQPFASANNSLIQTNFGFDVTVSGSDIATLFDSQFLNPGVENDDDLQGGPDGTAWDGGNLDRSTNDDAPILGNLFIVQNGATEFQDVDPETDLFTNPNDDTGNNQARFDFETGWTEIAFAWADNEEGGTTVTYGLDNGDEVTFDFGEFIDPNSPFFGGATLAYGDRFANLLPTIIVTDLIDQGLANASATQINWVEFNWGGPDGGASGGLAFFEGKTVDPVPEPNSFALILGFASALFVARRRTR